MEKAIFFIESWTVGITILSGEFGDEGAEGNEEGNDIAGDHVDSVTFGIGLTSLELQHYFIAHYSHEGKS